MSNTVTNQGKTIDQITPVDTISDENKKAYFIAQGVIPVSGPQGGETSATNKETLGVPVASISTDTSNKADKVVPAAAGNLATLNATGNLADSGIAATSVITSHQDISGKADKANPATEGNLAKLSATGDLVDSGSKVSDFATASQGTKADNAIQGVQLNGTTVTPDASKVVNILVDGGTKIRNSDSDVIGTIVLKGSGGVFVDPNTEEMQVGVDDTTIGLNTDDGELYVKNPVPAPAAAHADVGKVLTVKTVDNSDEIVWETPQGGGGGGNPYTKTTVTPAESYDSGRSSSTAEGYPYDGHPLYDQEVNIANNTYSILSTTIGYYPEYYDEGHEWESEYYHPEHALDTLIINLDANTEFPMAVVEFDVDSDSKASVNKIKVKVGNKILTRMYDAPHFEDFPVLDGNIIEFGNFEEHAATQWTPKSWEIGNVYYYNKSSNYFALTNSSTVQVHIFGNCFRVISDGTVGIPAAS